MPPQKKSEMPENHAVRKESAVSDLARPDHTHVMAPKNFWPYKLEIRVPVRGFAMAPHGAFRTGNALRMNSCHYPGNE